MPKKVKTNGGGDELGTEIKVTQTVKEKLLEENQEEEVIPEEIPEIISEVAPGALLVNEVLIESVVKILGKTLELLTRIPEMNFDEMEIEQLKTLWSPLAPQVSPLLAAVTGTAIIACSKATIYFSLRGKRTREPKRKKKSAEVSE